MKRYVEIDTFPKANQRTQERMYEILGDVSRYVDDPDVQIIALSLYGSQNYNLDARESDIDTELFIFPNKKNIIFNEPAGRRCETTKYGTCHIKDVRTMFNEIRKSSPNILELLASPYMIVNVEYQAEWELICNHIDHLAKLSVPKLVLGLRGLMSKYHDGMEEKSKYLMGCMRVAGIIEEIMYYPDTFSYSSLLIPTNLVELTDLRDYGTKSICRYEARYQDVMKSIDEFMPDVIGYSSPIYEQIKYYQNKLFDRYFKVGF